LTGVKRGNCGGTKNVGVGGQKGGQTATRTEDPNQGNTGGHKFYGNDLGGYMVGGRMK